MRFLLFFTFIFYHRISLADGPCEINVIKVETSIHPITKNPLIFENEDLSQLILKTERLTLIKLGPEMLQKVSSIWLDPQVQEMSGDKQTLNDVDKILKKGVYTTLQEWNKRMADPSSADVTINFGIYKGSELIGMAQIVGRAVNLADKKVVIWGSESIHLRPEFWGQGYGKEVFSKWIDFSFLTLGMERLQGRVLKTNLASKNLFLWAGFEETNNPGTGRQDNQFFYYRLDKSNYQSRPNSTQD
ncbi:MAG: GNAT family N-acetyltransferase [Bacteriovoracaceae bacterium]|nr:GNAT family N-acetyltransferase [Bacteriovoracaceae bacterium]